MQGLEATIELVTELFKMEQTKVLSIDHNDMDGWLIKVSLLQELVLVQLMDMLSIFFVVVTPPATLLLILTKVIICDTEAAYGCMLLLVAYWGWLFMRVRYNFKMQCDKNDAKRCGAV